MNNKFNFGKRLVSLVAIVMVATLLIISACVPAAVSPNTGTTGTGLPFIQSISATIMPTATSTPGVTVTPTATPATTSTPTATATPATTSTPTATMTTPGTTASPVATADMAQVYAANCAGCHGANRDGGMGPALTASALSNDSVAQLTSRVNHSGRLTAAQIPLMAAFLKNVSAATTTTTPTTTVPTSTPASTPSATTTTPEATTTPTTTPAVTPTATPNASPTVTPSQTPTTSPASTPAQTGAFSVMVSIQTTNFNVANNQGQSTVQGQGQVQFFMDTVPPVQTGVPLVNTPGMSVTVASMSYTWPSVSPGLHVFSAALANNDKTPLSPPVVASVLLLVPSIADTTMPQITTINTKINMGGTIPATTSTPSASVTNPNNITTPEATETMTPIATPSSTPAVITPSASAATTATLTPSASVTPSPGVTLSPTISTTPGATISPSDTVIPGSTETPTPTPTISPIVTPSPQTGTTSVTVSTQISNLNIMPVLGQASSQGSGHFQFFMDNIPSTFQNLPQVAGPSSIINTQIPSYTWMNVNPGVHIFGVQLVNNDGTSLNPPVIAATILTITSSGNNSSATPATTPTTSASPSVSPGASLTPQITPSMNALPSVSTTP